MKIECDLSESGSAIERERGRERGKARERTRERERKCVRVFGWRVFYY